MFLTLALMLDTGRMVDCVSLVKCVSSHIEKRATGDHLRGENSVYDDSFNAGIIYGRMCKYS